jgi:hypothetical protein
MQSRFLSGYGCVTATLKVLNVSIAFDSKQCCFAIFVDLAKAFDYGRPFQYWCLWGVFRLVCWLPLSKGAMYKVRTSAVSATACHQGSNPMLDPRPHALQNVHQQHSSGSRKLSHAFICRWYSLTLHLFIQRLNHGQSYWQLWLLRMMYYLYLLAFLCCCLCPIMFVPCFVLLPCCAAAMLSCGVATILCCHVLLLYYVVVLGLFYVVLWCLSCRPRRRPFAFW